METTHIDDAISSLEKANADLQPDLLGPDEVRHMLVAFAQAEKLASFGRTMLARKLNDAQEIARVSGTSIGKAKAALETGKALSEAREVRGAFRSGAISLDQAAEIARAEQASPGVASELISMANRESFEVFRERARRVVLEAEQHRGLGERQHEARSAGTNTDGLGMFNIHLRLQPHVGAPLVKRAETVAERLYRAAKKKGQPEPFERYLADAYAALLSAPTSSDASTKKGTRPELVMLVSYEIAKRGWKDVQEGEVCKIPGLGPIPPEAAKAVAEDAFLTGVFYDGKDLRQIKRWTRSIPVEVRLALELGDPPEFDGMKCVDCGSRFKNERDHVEPHTAGGEASVKNVEPRCDPCHDAKTLRDLRAGKFTRAGPDT